MKRTADGDKIRSLFGKNLKRLRSLYKISQMTLAGRADLTHNFINDIENGKKWLSADTMAKLAAALRVEPYQFFLPESVPEEKIDNFFDVYLDEFSNRVQKTAGEIKELKGQYLHNIGREAD